MTKYSFSHKAVSILLCFALLFSFAACFALSSHAETIAGTYTWRVRVNVGDNFDSTSNDSDRSFLTIKGGENNGTDAATIVVDQKKVEGNIITDYDDGTDVYLTNVLSGGDVGATKSVTTYTTSYFPTYFYMQLYKKGHAGFGIAKWSVYLEVQKSDGSWVTLCSDSASKTGGWGEMYNSGTCPSNLMPAASSVSFTKLPQSVINVPQFGEAAVTSEFTAFVYDQYGKVWYQEPNFAFNTYKTGVTIQNKAVIATSEANSANGSDETLTLSATHGALNATTNIKFINASYTYRFEDEQGNELSSGSLKYGQNVPQPASPSIPYDDTNHYIFNGWKPAVGKLTNNTVYRAQFTTEKHLFLSYASDNNATCTQNGTKTATCSCGKSDTVEIPDSALGHSYSSRVTKEATCTEKGEITFTCMRGDDSYTIETEALGHQYTSKIVESTCSKQGYTEYTCTVCKDTYQENFTPLLPHTWNSGEVTTEPTCTEEGQKLFHCTQCEATKYESVEPIGHAFNNWTIRNAPTCTVDGERFATCIQCKHVITEPIPAQGHKWSEWTTTAAATCESNGQKDRTCSVCHEHNPQTIPATGHDMQLKKREPNDGSAGMYYYECANNCGKYACCEMDASGVKTVGEVVSSIAAVQVQTADIPAPTFNTFNRVESNYNYGTRGASLKVLDVEEGVQPLRFISSVLLPTGAQIEDFGYIYIRSDYFRTLKTFVLGGKNVAELSVKDGNYSSFQTEQGEVKTFNLVINVKEENWDYDYITRPYIVYTYAGEEFTIYDQIYSSRSVNYIAQQVMENPLESQYVKDYISTKILKNVSAN